MLFTSNVLFAPFIVRFIPLSSETSFDKIVVESSTKVNILSSCSVRPDQIGVSYSAQATNVS